MVKHSSSAATLSPDSMGLQELWRGTEHGRWFVFIFTSFALLFVFVYHSFWRALGRRSVGRRDHHVGEAPRMVTQSESSSLRLSIVSDVDLRNLMTDLEDDSSRDNWEPVIDKRNNLVSYNAKCFKAEGGPLKYVSETTFEKCSSSLLRDFYMDNEYRKVWDKTVVEYEQLEINEDTGVEIGRMVKKFPLLSPREYVLAWRIWEGKDQEFYCITKDCNHSLAPQQKKYVRVKSFFSGWRIRKVPDREACEIKIAYVEDAGMNSEVAKLVFAKGIWSYICKMDSALRKYPSTNVVSSRSELSAIRFMQKVPPYLETQSEISRAPAPELSRKEAARGKLLQKPSKKTITKGLMLVGSAVVLARSHSSLGAKLAMFCIVNNLVKGRTAASRVETNQTGPSRASRIRSSIPQWPDK
ncbi:uncharacterized protein LOC116267299 [Nymphaea colorata]|nr:uncharacterized protein LOC116267299 [Nymphaea colorata]